MTCPSTHREATNCGTPVRSAGGNVGQANHFNALSYYVAPLLFVSTPADRALPQHQVTRLELRPRKVHDPWHRLHSRPLSSPSIRHCALTTMTVLRVHLQLHDSSKCRVSPLSTKQRHVRTAHAIHHALSAIPPNNAVRRVK
jgi:hypothetical protein